MEEGGKALCLPLPPSPHVLGIIRHGDGCVSFSDGESVAFSSEHGITTRSHSPSSPSMNDNSSSNSNSSHHPFNTHHTILITITRSLTVSHDSWTSSRIKKKQINRGIFYSIFQSPEYPKNVHYIKPLQFFYLCHRVNVVLFIPTDIHHCLFALFSCSPISFLWPLRETFLAGDLLLLIATLHIHQRKMPVIFI